MADAPVEDRRKFNDFLLAQPATRLLDVWLDEVTRRHDRFRLDLIAVSLSHALKRRNPETQQVLARIKGLIEDSSRDAFSRWHLVEMLGETATTDTLDMLLEIARSPGTDLLPIALRQIARIGDDRPSGTFREDLSPLLERTWIDESLQEPLLLSAVALAMAKIGSASAVKLLLEAILSAGRTVDQFEQRNDPKGWTAFDALPALRNLHSLSLLEEILQTAPPSGMDTIAAGRSLAAMGESKATKALLGWAQGQPIDVGALIYEWFLSMRDRDSVELATQAAMAGPFANSLNQAALRKAVADWKAHRSG